MTKKLAFGAAAAASLMAAPASAATFVSNINFAIGNCAVQCTGLFGNGATVPTFDDYFTLTIPNNGTLAGQSQAITINGNLTFSSVYLQGPGLSGPIYNFTITNGNPSQAVLNPTGGALSGAYRLYVAGAANAQGTGYAGNITLAAVPEPATWALFILGFGGLGLAMRRRNAQVRVAKALLNFA